MNISIQKIKINQINIYRLNAFPEERVNILISELNVHYGKINGYIEAEIDVEKINIEVIDSLAKLEEISRLAPYRIDLGQHGCSGDFSLGIDLLNSVIALLQTAAGRDATRRKLLNLGWELLRKLYNYSFDELIDKSLLYHWLKSKNLARPNDVTSWRDYNNSRDENLAFIPSEDDIESYYKKNNQKIYEYMVHEMSDSQSPSDPFLDAQAGYFYHYHQTLSNTKIREA